MKTTSVQIGGKLYITGEYVILTSGQAAILKSIPIRMIATVKEAEKITLFSNMFDYVTDTTVDKNCALIRQIIVTLATYLGRSLHNLPAFKLDITRELERDSKEFGAGSGGSIVVLMFKALSAFHELNLLTDTIFKLVSYASLKLGDSDSIGGITCIVYDDLVAFTSLDRQKVSTWITTKDIKTTLVKDWGYHIKIIKPALACNFLVGRTRQPSISKDMINLVKPAVTKAFPEGIERNVQICKQAL